MDAATLKRRMLYRLRDSMKGLVEPGENFDFDAEAAIYWYASDNYSGQGDPLYGILSTSKFRPGPSHRSVADEGELPVMMYRELERDFGKKIVRSMKFRNPPVRKNSNYAHQDAKLWQVVKIGRSKYHAIGRRPDGVMLWKGSGPTIYVLIEKARGEWGLGRYDNKVFAHPVAQQFSRISADIRKYVWAQQDKGSAITPAGIWKNSGGSVRKNIFTFNNPPSGPADEHAARELELFVENDADLYRQQYIPIVKNLMLKRQKGVYDREKAVKLFMYLMESGAKKYIAQFSTPGQRIDTVFNKATREQAARSFRDSFEGEADLGNWDHLLVRVSKGGLKAAVARRTGADEFAQDMAAVEQGYRYKLIRRTKKFQAPGTHTTYAPIYARSTYEIPKLQREWPGETWTIVDLASPRSAHENPRGGVRKNIFVFNNPKRPLNAMERAANAVGLAFGTWAPGDGLTRYRFFVKSKDSPYADYNQGGALYTANGRKDALAFINAYGKGRSARTNPLNKREVDSINRDAVYSFNRSLNAKSRYDQGYHMGEYDQSKRIAIQHRSSVLKNPPSKSVRAYKVPSGHEERVARMLRDAFIWAQARDGEVLTLARPEILKRAVEYVRKHGYPMKNPMTKRETSSVVESARFHARMARSITPGSPYRSHLLGVAEGQLGVASQYGRGKNRARAGEMVSAVDRMAMAPGGPYMRYSYKTIRRNPASILCNPTCNHAHGSLENPYARGREHRSYQDFLARKRAEYGSKFDSSDLDPRFVPYYENGRRIWVNDFGHVTSGTVGVTTGWRPVFLLIFSSRSMGSSTTLTRKTKILGEVGVYKPRRGEYGEPIENPLLQTIMLANPPISAQWDALGLRQRLELLEIVGYPEEIAGSYALDRWSTLSASAKSALERQWFDSSAPKRGGTTRRRALPVGANPLTRRESGKILRSARRSVEVGSSFRPGHTRSAMAGKAIGKAHVVTDFGPRSARGAERMIGTTMSNPGSLRLPAPGTKMTVAQAMELARRIGNKALIKECQAAAKLQTKANSNAKSVTWKHLPMGSRDKIDSVVALTHYGDSPEDMYRPPKGSKKGPHMYRHKWGDGTGRSKPVQVLASPSGKMIVKVMGPGQKVGDWMRG